MNTKAENSKIKKMNEEVKESNTVIKAKIEKPKNLVSAVIHVMNSVKGVEKSMTVGMGKNSYKGVSDYDVKKVMSKAMAEAGLIILPVSVDPTINIERWIENTQYGDKQKQSVFTEVKTKYKLMHESGESEIIEGYGHGIDSMDKSAGKALTYSLKMVLLYTFLIPTGAIDDTDTDHSDDTPVKPVQPVKKEVIIEVGKPTLSDDRFTKACNTIDEGKYSIERLKKEYDLTEKQLNELDEWQKTKI